MQKYYYVKRTNNFRRRKNPFPIFLSFIVVVILLTGSVVFLLRIHKEPEKSVLATEVARQIEPTFTPSPTPQNVANNSELEAIVLEELEGTTATYSAVIKNLKTGQVYSLNEHKRYTAASLYKLWVLSKSYSLINKGTLKEDDLLSADVKSLNESLGDSTGSAGLTQGSIKMTIKEGLRRMITFSDNYSAVLLTRKIKLASFPPYLKEAGFSETLIGSRTALPYTTAHDTAQFFEKLYKGQLADQEKTTKMLDLLKAQTLNKKLPRYLPDNIVIAHKTGELDDYSHDAGIVFTPKGDYVIVVLSKSNAPNLANNRIANISEAVYKFFISK